MPEIVLPADGEKPYGTKLRTAIELVNGAVDATTEAIANGSAVTDSGVTAVLSNPLSGARVELDEAYATVAQGAKADVAVPNTGPGRAALAASTEITEAINSGISSAGVDPLAQRKEAVGAGLRLRAATAERMARTNPDVTVIGLVSVNEPSFVTGTADRVYAYDRANSRVNTALVTSTGNAVQAGATSPKFNMLSRDTSTIVWERQMGAVTFTASNDRATFSAAHGLDLNDQIRFAGISGASGVTATMYVKSIVSSTVVTLSATSGGTTVDITTDGSATGSATGTETGTGIKVETQSVHSQLDIILYNNGSGNQYIYVDDVLVATVTAADFTQSGVAAGLQARLGLKFANAVPRVIAWETISGTPLVGFDVPTGVPLTRPALTGDYARTLLIGDSFTEGTGSGSGRPLAWWLAQHLRWKNAWKMGSGSVGIAANGARVNWLSQTSNIIALNPQRIIVLLPYNDRGVYEAGASAYLTQVQSFFTTLINALPSADIFWVGPWPNGGGQGSINASYVAMDADLKTLAGTLGVGYWSPIQAGWKFSLSDATHPDTIGHQKLGWLIAGVLQTFMPSSRAVPLSESSIAPASPALPEPFTVVDTFERADTATSGGNYLGTTERGAKTWNLIGSPTTAYIASGTAKLTSSARSGVGVDVGSTNGHVRATLGSFPAAGIIGQWVRCTDSTSGLIVCTNSDGTSSGTLGYTLLERTSTGVNVLASSAVAPAIGDVIDIYMNGTTVKVRVNGTEILSTTSAPTMTGQIAGPYTNGGGNSGSWRDFFYSKATAPWV